VTQKLLLLGILVAGIWLIVRAQVRTDVAHAGMLAGIPLGNGDVNGDGAIDIGDGIYIINYEFMGGPPPVPYQDPALLDQIAGLKADLAAKSAALESCASDLATAQAVLGTKTADLERCNQDLISTQASLAECQASGGLRGLPDTGQDYCVNFVNGQGWVKVPCQQAVCARQDGAISSGCPMDGRFQDNGDGTVTDNCTGLMWQKDFADVNHSGQFDEGDRPQWCTAAAYCSALRLGGHDDWRLPNLRELQSIVDYGRHQPAWDPVFTGVSNTFWTSTAYDYNSDTLWLIDFYDGSLYGNNGRLAQSSIRAVRTAD
jgi:uncharacterized protein DUF1566